MAGLPLPILDPSGALAEMLDRGDVSGIAKWEAKTPEEHFLRGVARVESGNREGAAADFEAALPSLGLPCRVELAFLNLASTRGQEQAAELVNELLGSGNPTGLIEARIHHLGGLARYHLRYSDKAIDHLLRSIALYQAEGDAVASARVRDTLGMVHAAQGNQIEALSSYALSLAGKSATGDRAGVALTMGNIGRLHLAGGFFKQALEFFLANLDACRQLGDRRAELRASLSVARALSLLGDHDSAISHLRELLPDLKRANEIEFLVYAEEIFCRLCLESGDLPGARAHLAACREAVGLMPEDYLSAVIMALEGSIALVAEDRAAVSHLENALARFVEIELPEHEIGVRRELASAYLFDGRMREAANGLIEGISVARERGLLHHLRQLSEALAQVDFDARPQDASGKDAAERSIGPTGYHFLEQVGAGGFGTVYRAFDPITQNEVALKTIDLSGVYDRRRREALLDSALREIESASLVDHPGIEKVFAVGRTGDGSAYVAKEFVHGPRLDHAMLLERDALDPMLLFKRLAEALGELHDAGIVHRDVKPSNIILRKDAASNMPVLVDFGLAVPVGSDEVGSGGTPGYAAPEQINGGQVSPASDVYALGMVMVELLTEEVPQKIDRKLLRRQLERGAAAGNWNAERIQIRDGEMLLDLLLAMASPIQTDRPQSGEEVAASLAELFNL